MPTFKFHNDLNKYGHREMLENNVKDYRTASIINDWKILFINDVRNYIKSIYEEKAAIPGKLCRDWHSYINDIKNKINELGNDNAIIRSELLSNMDNFYESIINDSDISICANDVKKEYDCYGEKLLHDVCENAFYISDNLIEINNSPNCKNFQDYLKTNKSLLDDLLQENYSYYSTKKYPCSIEDVGEMIQEVHCVPFRDPKVLEPRRDVQTLATHASDFSEQSEEEPVFREDGSNSMDKILQIATSSALSVVGVSLIGFLFYKVK
ncbi:hypothetical protein POCGH01_00236600 [Plasmodium ovale]|uniref:PIR protein n=1 Tax=Plasmodium ovale TaxID=36330 RepID=A0A1D3JFY7_PLAOA|nr:hypothetical protein POCGH01_00236600 [Plasmodium ovale]